MSFQIIFQVFFRNYLAVNKEIVIIKICKMDYKTNKNQDALYFDKLFLLSFL